MLGHRNSTTEHAAFPSSFLGEVGQLIGNRIRRLAQYEIDITDFALVRGEVNQRMIEQQFGLQSFPTLQVGWTTTPTPLFVCVAEHFRCFELTFKKPNVGRMLLLYVSKVHSKRNPTLMTELRRLTRDTKRMNKMEDRRANRNLRTR